MNLIPSDELCIYICCYYISKSIGCHPFIDIYWENHKCTNICIHEANIQWSSNDMERQDSHSEKTLETYRQDPLHTRNTILKWIFNCKSEIEMEQFDTKVRCARVCLIDNKLVYTCVLCMCMCMGFSVMMLLIEKWKWDKWLWACDIGYWTIICKMRTCRWVEMSC